MKHPAKPYLEVSPYLRAISYTTQGSLWVLICCCRALSAASGRQRDVLWFYSHCTSLPPAPPGWGATALSTTGVTQEPDSVGQTRKGVLEHLGSTHGITEWFGLEGASELIQFHLLPWTGTFPLPQAAPSPSSLSWDTFSPFPCPDQHRAHLKVGTASYTELSIMEWRVRSFQNSPAGAKVL